MSSKIHTGVEHHKSKIAHFKWTQETNLCTEVFCFFFGNFCRLVETVKTGHWSKKVNE